MQSIAEILARELEKPLAHVQNVIDLLDEGNTIPFIARYRKELHGSMDDTALRTLEDRLNYLRNLAQRREEVKNAIDGQGKLTQELSGSTMAPAGAPVSSAFCRQAATAGQISGVTPACCITISSFRTTSSSQRPRVRSAMPA